MKQLSADIYQFDLRQANVFLIKGENGLTLIDTAVVGIRDKLETQLAKYGFHLEDVKRILVTHAHIDHVGGLREIQEATGAEVWAHRLEAPVVRGEEPVTLPNPADVGLADSLFGRFISLFVGSKQPPAPVHRELDDGETLDEVLPGLRVIHLPGHSPGQIGFWLEPERLLIGGDVMMHLTPWLTRPLGAYTPDTLEAEQSILKVANLDVHTLGVGHGSALVGNAGAAIKRLAEKIHKTARLGLTAQQLEK